MQFRLIRTTLAQPIERIRGGRGVVAMNCVFARAHERVEVTGLGFFDEDTDAAIAAARETALKDGSEQAKKIIEGQAKVAAGHSTVTQVMRETVAKPQAEQAKAAKVAAGQTDIAKKLEQAAPEHSQQALNEMCEAIGMEPLYILGQDGSEPWSAGEVIAMTEYLRNHLRRFEASDEARRAY